MCYDISYFTDVRRIVEFFNQVIFDSQIELEFGPSAHIQGVSVFGDHPILYVNREDFRVHCRLMSWSCIEYYQRTMPDWKKRNGMLNIRAERILDDPNSYWYKIRNRRCLIPVTGIYEHRGVKGGSHKVPYLVRPKDQQQMFFLPGLYSVVELPDKDTGEIKKHWTFGLITTAANDVMHHIHNDGENRGRMPLFLPLDMSKKFLQEDLTAERYRAIINYKMPSNDLAAHPTWTIRTAKLRLITSTSMKHGHGRTCRRSGRLTPIKSENRTT